MCSSVSWEQNPKLLADCGYGFGKATTGGRDGDLYYVTDDRDDDIVNPPPGTLRHGVLQDKPLWIMFKRNMVIHLKAELIITNDKTIDGRGVNVVLTGGGCITIQDVQNIIVHGLTIYGCQAVGGFEIRSSMSHVGVRELSDGDAISISHSKNIWIDHNTLSACKDGLVDVVAGSDAITISNNHFSNHNETILLGHLDTYTADKDMHVTLVYNRFGEKLIQRLPRCRLGTFHVVNNYYEGWEMYAIGHSANPTILSQGNVFNAATYGVKEVVHVNEEGDRSGNVLSVGDEMLGGAIFTATGSLSPSFYAKAASLTVRSPHMVDDMTKHAGAGFV
ncbi:unnamed protein product [Cuscuta epithymum]|nr:unnamed protein product [Cuscuta epithymum]